MDAFFLIHKESLGLNTLYLKSRWLDEVITLDDIPANPDLKHILQSEAYIEHVRSQVKLYKTTFKTEPENPSQNMVIRTRLQLSRIPKKDQVKNPTLEDQCYSP